MEDLFKLLDYLENRIANNVLNKNKQFTLDQFFENNMKVCVYFFISLV